MHFDVPFGPVIGKVSLPEDEFKTVLALVEDLRAQKEKKLAGMGLAGEIEKEWKIDKVLLEKYGLSKMLEECVEKYANQMNNRYYRQILMPQNENDNKLVTKSAWLNVMKRYEYNPIHYHTGCKLSCILYVKTPDLMKSNVSLKPDSIRKNKDHRPDGRVEFIYGSSVKGSGNRATCRYRPKAGDLYIFPSFLLHTVYPFDNEEERISIAANF